MSQHQQVNSVSALIITFNEEQVIKDCLNSLVWAQEIVVVDGGSTDKTLSILKDPSAPWATKIKIVENPWPGFRVQRNLALESASHPWVLFVDSDETCSEELKLEIESLLTTPPQQKYYKVRRQEYFLGKPIHYGIWNPSYQDRFFHKKGIEYINDIHEYPSYPSTPSRIHAPLLHAKNFNPHKFLDKMNRYTTIEARDRFEKGKRTNAFRILFAFPSMFLKNYFYYKAYRDGYHGFIISILEGISRAVRHIKMWQLQKGLSRES